MFNFGGKGLTANADSREWVATSLATIATGQGHLAVSEGWGSLLQVSLQNEPDYFGVYEGIPDWGALTWRRSSALLGFL